MTVLPFVCLAIGIVSGVLIKSYKFLKVAEVVMTVALVFLMLTIGIGIGMNETIVKNIPKIGINCAVIASAAIFFSIMFTFILEKTILPLKALDEKIKYENIDISVINNTEESSGDGKTKNHLVWIMPISVVIGFFSGILFRSWIIDEIVDISFTISLAVLYICVGISQGANKGIFKFIKLLGFRIILLPIAITVGSLVGGYVAGILLGLPSNISVVSSAGMSFYSVTGAIMTDNYGLEAGTYGFVVNIMREVFTIILMPVLIKVSSGSPIAGGAAGNMDTMLAPITKFVGVRLGLVTLITGTLLTFVVMVLLPVLISFL